MSASNDQQWHPATFQERGVSIPFTTPALAGARGRMAARGLELIVPHPAGVRGVYIMARSEMGNFCTATLHDLRLAERLDDQPSLSPQAVRAASRDVATQGIAGRAAADAARSAREADHTACLMTNIALLQMLVQQTGGGACGAGELDKRAKAAILRLAPALGRAPAQVTNDIEALAGLFVPIGLGAAAARARCTQLTDAMEHLAQDVRHYQGADLTQASLGAWLIASAAEATVALARQLMDHARARAGDMPALLAAWVNDAAGTAAMLGRAEWLLDGWDQICLVWQLADGTNRRGSMTEMALMVPVIPRQAETWLGTVLDESERLRLRKLVHGFEDWRTGSLVVELVARNERIRALAA